MANTIRVTDLDFVFISYREPNADENYADLLNIVPWAQDFQSMKAISGMTESRHGFLATFPMDFGIPLIPIDHILHSRHFSTAFCTTVPLPGSDHKGLISGLNWN